MLNRLTINAAELAADYKARGLTKYKAWDQFVIDRGLRPEMDARAFYGVFETVTASVLYGPRKAAYVSLADCAPFPTAGRVSLFALESADYGRPVEIANAPGSRVCGLHDGEALHGDVERTLNAGTLYEVRIVPDNDENRATTFRYRAENVRFLD